MPHGLEPLPSGNIWILQPRTQDTFHKPLILRQCPASLDVSSFFLVARIYIYIYLPLCIKTCTITYYHYWARNLTSLFVTLSKKNAIVEYERNVSRALFSNRLYVRRTIFFKMHKLSLILRDLFFQSQHNNILVAQQRDHLRRLN